MEAKKLLEQEKSLKRTLQAGQVEKNQLERDITKAKAQLKTLTPKVEAKQAEYNALVGKHVTLQVQNDELNVSNTDYRRSLKSMQAEIDSLDAQIESKTVKLKQNLAEYEASQRAEIDKQLAEYKESKLTNIDAEIDSKTAELTIVEDKHRAKSQDLITVRQNILDEREAADKKLRDVEAEAERLSKSFEELQVLEDELKQSVKEAQFARDQAVSARDKALIEHNQFIKYEQKARASLKAKDDSLQERESEVESNSRFLVNQRSNLPQM